MNTCCTFWDSPSFWCSSPNLQVYTFILDNYPLLLEGNVKSFDLPKFSSLIWIKEGFIKKNLGTFQIRVDNNPPPKIWKISGYLHKETCKMHLFSTLSQFSEICRGNIFYIFLFVIWKHCKIVKFLLACMKNVWHFSVLETPPPYMVNNFLINFLDELDRYIHFLKFPFQK